MKSPKSFRLHIGIFGRRNAGKSSILNALTGQVVSIVSEISGTTTDPVEKPMELLPYGPVLFIDTAGIDDTGYLGDKRVARTLSVFERTDLGILVTTGAEWGYYEQQLINDFRDRGIPFIVVFNKSDIIPIPQEAIQTLQKEKIKYAIVSALQKIGIDDLRNLLLETAPDEVVNRTSIMADLVGPGEMAVLVVPIDKEAPKGRLILPQVQCIRDLLDHNSFCIVVKENELNNVLSRLTIPPKIVVTDSQAFRKVAAETPQTIPLTSFSILFARFQGDLAEFAKGAQSIATLKPGDKVLIAEACTHHPIGEDIGTVKIPKWLNSFVGGDLNFVNHRGHDLPDDLTGVSLIIHCGACMWNRREMLSRILFARKAGVPITNYGLSIAFTLGIFERALQPFPEALEALKQ